MPRIRLESLAIRSFFLGALGFDHFQLVFEPLAGGRYLQDDWYVIEGTREATSAGPLLGVQGADGAVSLASANAASGNHLVRKIGRPEQRWLADIEHGPRAAELWAQLSSVALDIDLQQLPYVAFAATNSIIPTVNSTSVISTMLERTGLAMPRLPWIWGIGAPGSETLIGSSSSETMVSSSQHTTLLGGPGDDKLMPALSLSPAPLKFYGGPGQDVCVAAEKLSLCHGGLPGTPQSQDGHDVAWFNVSTSTIDAAPSAGDEELHVSSEGSATRLLSIETVRWTDRDDHVQVGAGFMQHAVSPPVLDLGHQAASGAGDVLDMTDAGVALRIGVYDDEVSVVSDAGMFTARSVETLVASSADDFVWLNGSVRAVRTGAGADLLYISAAPALREVDLGSGPDILLIDLSRAAMQTRTIEIAAGDPYDRIAVLASPAACDAASLSSAQLSAPGTYDGISVAMRAETDQVTVTLSDRGSMATLILVLDGYRAGDWGLSPHADNSLAPNSDEHDCEKRGAYRQNRSVAEIVMPQSIVPSMANGIGAWCAACVLSDRSRHRARDRHGAAARDHSDGAECRAGYLHARAWRDTRRHRHHRRRNDSSRRRLSGACIRRPSTTSSSVSIVRCGVVAAGTSARSPNRTAAGPPGRAGLRRRCDIGSLGAQACTRLSYRSR